LIAKLIIFLNIRVDRETGVMRRGRDKENRRKGERVKLMSLKV